MLTGVTRGSYLGSHDSAAIAGDHPFLSKMQVYLNKLGLTEPREVPERMLWGTRMQEVILQAFAERTGLEVEPERFIRHEKLNWFGGTPDGTIKNQRRGVEAKNIRFADPQQWGDEGTDQVARYVLWQCHHLMTLLDYEAWDVAVLFGGAELRIYTVERDKELSDMIVDMDQRFWTDHVMAQVPPEIDGSPAAKAYLDRTYKTHSDQIRKATPEEQQVMADYKAALSEMEKWEVRGKMLENRIRAAIGNDMGLTSDLGKITWKEQAGARRLDTKALKEAHPEIAEQFTRAGDPQRVFRKQFFEKEQE